MTPVESQNIEYKQSWRDEYLKWICGFANAQGGILFIGVNDDGTVCGVENAKKLMEDIPNKVRDVLGLIVDTPEWSFDGTGIWVVFKLNTVRPNSREVTKIEYENGQDNNSRQQTPQNIIQYLKKNPNATQKELVSAIPNISLGGIKYQLSRLQKLGVLKRIGGARGGYWLVVEH